MLIRLRGCAGWSAPLLFAYGIKQFSHDLAHLMDESYTWSVGSVGNKPHKTYLNPKVSWNLATGSAGWLRSCFFLTIKWPVDQHWLYNEYIIWKVPVPIDVWTVLLHILFCCWRKLCRGVLFCVFLWTQVSLIWRCSWRAVISTWINLTKIINTKKIYNNKYT